jgi:GTPase SAR1 family protein
MDMARDDAYCLAEKKIRECARSAKKLALWELGLSEIPDSLIRLTQLQSVDLTSNSLKILPVSLGKLTQLQELRISYNLLTTLPKWLKQLTQLQALYLRHNMLGVLPEELGQLTQLQSLDLSGNQLTELPEWLGNLTQLQSLDLSENQLTSLPERLGNLTQLRFLQLSENLLRVLPDSLGQLNKLENFYINNNQLTDLPASLYRLKCFDQISFGRNRFNPELSEAIKEGHQSVKGYLHAKAKAQVKLNEAKLILIGEGEVGKSCLLGALRGDEWEECRPTTHGIEIKPFLVTNPDSHTEITLNGWDFGGQRVYRPTHQLFFSAPAVYLVVWKPREGPQQGFVKEWIKLVKHREPEAKILVVATHGGCQQRQPDIDRQELWDIFGKDTVIDFLHVESKPDNKGKRRGIDELKRSIACVASTLPEMGRAVPKRWQDVREVLAQSEAAYLPLERVLELCHVHQMDDDEARLFITISHRLGHLIHYQHDPTLRDIVVLKPDWLATAISFVLDDEATRHTHGLVSFSRLSQLWNDPSRAADSRYPATLHPIFLRLLERFDLSYRVAGLSSKSNSDPASLIAQLVPDTRPAKDLEIVWPPTVASGDTQQVQICRVVDARNGQSATAEGLFFQLIVRLHKYSLGREDYHKSVHWQRGIVLDDDYNGRALLEHIGNDLRIRVRAPYPERFLAMLTAEVKYLVESFWEGLRCDVMVPCIEPCRRNEPCAGLFEVEKLIDSKRRNRSEYPCPVCNEWQSIDSLLRNAPAAQPIAAATLFAEFAEVKQELVKVRQQLTYQGEKTMGRFDLLDDRTRRILSRIDNAYTGLMQALTDEAKEGPRLFSLVPVDRSNFNPREWLRAKFRITLWCEHSRMTLPSLDGKDSKNGVYEIELTREWFIKAGPYLKLMTGTLSLVLPVASSAIKLTLDEAAYKAIEEQLDFGKSVIDATIGEGTKVGEWMGASSNTITLEHGEAIRAQGATLRKLHALLKAKDPGFGGLVRVMNKRQEFLWVHPQFEKEY